MRIDSLRLEQFRSYQHHAFPVKESGIHMLIGVNGSGKTNVLEALSLLSRGQSFLADDEESVIRWNYDFCRVQASVNADDGTLMMVEAFIQAKPRKQKAYSKNDIRLPRSRFVGVVPSIAFLPSDLDLFTGSPSGRRTFLDANIAQLQPDFTRIKIEYDRTLKQRNALLRSIAEGKAREAELDHWDAVLAHAAMPILERRTECVEAFNQSLASMLIFLGETWSDVVMRAEHCSIHTPNVTMADVTAALTRVRQRDILLQNTSVGPHRDDWHIAADGRSIASFASRGQQRTVLLAMLLIITELFRTRRHERPIILLDDVFSELDDEHQRHLLSTIGDCQVFLTSTHLPAWTPDSATLWTVNDGTILPMPRQK